MSQSTHAPILLHIQIERVWSRLNFAEDTIAELGTTKAQDAFHIEPFPDRREVALLPKGSGAFADGIFHVDIRPHDGRSQDTLGRLLRELGTDKPQKRSDPFDRLK